MVDAGNVLNHLRGRHLRRRTPGLAPGRRAVRADRPGQLLGCDRPAGDRNRLRRQHRRERVGDQPLRPDARRRHRRLRADLRPGRRSPAPRRRRQPDDRRCAGGSAGAQLRDPARRPDRPGRRSRGRAHPGRGHHQRALLRIRPGDGPRPRRRLRRRGELHRAAGRRRRRGSARLARGDRPADARRRCSCPLLWRSVPTEGSGARLDLFGAALVAGDRRWCGAARAVPLDRPDRGHRRRGAGGARRTGRRGVGTPSPERLPAGRGDPQPCRRTQCPRGRSRARGVVRPADRRARRPGGSRLGALAGRRGTPAERRGRAGGSPVRRSAARPGRARPGHLALAGDDRGRVAAGFGAGRLLRFRLAAGDRRGRRDPVPSGSASRP